LQEAGTPVEQLQVFSWFRERVLARCPDNSITHHNVLRQLSADRYIFCHMESWHHCSSSCCLDKTLPDRYIANFRRMLQAYHGNWCMLLVQPQDRFFDPA